MGGILVLHMPIKFPRGTYPEVLSYKSFVKTLTFEIRYYIERVLSLYPKSNIMSTKEIVSMEIQKEINKVVSDKLETFIFTCIEDCQDTLIEDCEMVNGFEQGILPPRYKELKEELETIIQKYLVETIIVDEFE
jgi:hypothetical protein